MYKTLFYSTRKNYVTCFLMVLLAVSAVSAGMLYTSNLAMNAKNYPAISAVQKISAGLLEKINGCGMDSIKILVETFDQNYQPVKSLIESLGGTVSFEYRYVNGLAAVLPADKIFTLAEDSHVKRIYLDEMRYPSLISSKLPLIDDKWRPVPISAEDRNRFDEIQHPIPQVNYEYPTDKVLPITLMQEQIEILADLIEPNTYWNPVAMDAVHAWALGDYGQDSLVVVIDTGIYADHFMLAGSVIGGVDLSPDVDTEYEGWNLATNHWHGTHVAGIIAGHGAILVHSSDPLYRSISMYAAPPPEASSIGYPGYHIIPLFGMAPEAQLYAIKVFPHTGAGVSESIIINAIEYAISMKLEQEYDVDVISMSLGGPTTFDGRDLEDQIVDYATSVGITVVAAAGNEGPASMTIGSPGSAESAITVAAAAHPVNTRVFWDINYGKQGIGWQLFTSDIPQIYAFSSRGPTSDGRDKPDVAATGLFVLSAYIEEQPQGLGWASGTSMATPAVSGAVALLNTYAEAFIPDATPLDYKQAIKNGAVWLDGYGKYDQGAGYLNAYNALVALVNDPSIGDAYPPLPEEYGLIDISNIPIVEAGVYEGTIENLAPGMKHEYIFKVTEATASITLEITNVDIRVRNPYILNSFEIYIQSAKRTMYAYWIETANVWGDAEFVITDYGTTWSGWVTGVYSDPYTLRTAIEPGYVKIVIENDWTSSGSISCDFKIEVTAAPSIEPDEVYSDTIDVNEWDVFSITPPAGTEKVTLELWWENDWSTYPTSDLDLYVQWFNGTDLVMEPLDEGATLNSPERVVIEASTIEDIEIYIYGYAIWTGQPENWTLKVYYG